MSLPLTVDFDIIIKNWTDRFNQDCSLAYFEDSYSNKSFTAYPRICMCKTCFKEIRWMNTQKACLFDSQLYMMSCKR